MTRRCSLALAALAMTGCASYFEMGEVAKNHAIADLACPEKSVDSQYMGRTTIGFRGCGRWIAYRCMWSSAGGAQCLPVAQGETKTRIR